MRAVDNGIVNSQHPGRGLATRSGSQISRLAPLVWDDGKNLTGMTKNPYAATEKKNRVARGKAVRCTQCAARDVSNSPRCERGPVPRY